MQATANGPTGPTDWQRIDWRGTNGQVRNLRQRIFPAAKHEARYLPEDERKHSSSVDIALPAPDEAATCALCNLAIYPSTEYVLTWDDDGRELWWHMDCRDRVIPLLLVELDSDEQQ